MSQPSPSANRQGALCSCSCEQRGPPPPSTSDPNGWFYGRPLAPLNLFCYTAILHRRQASGKKRTKPKLFPLSKYSRWNIPPLHRLTTLHLSYVSGAAQLNLVTCVRMLSSFSCVLLFATLWTIARQAPLSMGFSRQESWSGLSCPPPGDLPDPGTELVSPACRQIFHPLSHLRSPT